MNFTKKSMVVFLGSIIYSCFFVTLSNADEKKSDTALPNKSKKFIEWIHRNGFSELFKFVSETDKNDSLTVTLDADGFEMAIDNDKNSKKLYMRLYSKLLSTTEFSPEKVDLHILVDRGGYCDPATIDKHIEISKDGKFEISEKVIKEPEGYACMLNFEFIKQYEMDVKSSFANAKNLIVSTEQNLSMDKIKKYLETRYIKAGGEIKITLFSKNTITAIVENVKKEVIRDQNYWERLKFFSTILKEGDSIHLNMVLDGQYAAGLTKPTEQAYIDMEPKYTSSLFEYGKALAFSITEEEK